MEPSREFTDIYGCPEVIISRRECCEVRPCIGMPPPDGYTARTGDIWKNSRTRMVLLALGGASRRRRPTTGLHFVHLYGSGESPSLWGCHSKTMVEFGSPIEMCLKGFDSESWVYCGSIFDRLPYDSI